MIKMNYSKRPLILIFSLVAFLLVLFSITNVKSYKVQPPAYYCNDPNPFQSTVSCTYCHSSFTAFHDSTNFNLLMGTDSQSLSPVTTGVTTYIPGMTYYMRVFTSSPSAVHGFELTADDTANTGTEVTNFAVLDPTNTALAAVSYNFISHHNATSNGQWTFTWTAPTTYRGPITFYYAGNDGVAGDTNIGDSIFVANKTITVNPADANGIINIADKLNSLTAFPTVFEHDVQVSFTMKENAQVQATVINMQGQVVKTIFNESLSAGSFNRSVDLGGLAQGIYLVKVQIGNGYALSKIIKQ